MKVYDRRLLPTKNPGEHVKEMDANICGNSTRLGELALPTLVIPTTTRCDVCDVDIRCATRVLKLLAKRNDGGVKT